MPMKASLPGLPLPRAAGNRIDFANCAIAAIAMARGFILATRNTKDFKGAGVELLNPWGFVTKSAGG